MIDILQWIVTGLVIPAGGFLYHRARVTEARFSKSDADRVQMKMDIALTRANIDAMQKTHDNELARFGNAVEQIARDMHEHRTEMRQEVKALRSEMVEALKDIGAKIFKLIEQGSK
jgi:uncharacterized protein YjiS (DUF1127 family)